VRKLTFEFVRVRIFVTGTFFASDLAVVELCQFNFNRNSLTCEAPCCLVRIPMTEDV